MRILIISQYPWNKENSFGNTYSSIFGKVPNIEIAQIYLMEGKPDFEPVVKRYYQIPEGSVVKSVFKRGKKNSVGKEVFFERDLTETTEKASSSKQSWYSKLLSIGKRHHWRWMFWMRELAWKYGNINYEGMMDFIRDFNPDIFFLPYNHIFYTNRLALYIKERIDVPMVMEMAMDHYSLNRVSYDPIFWIDRFAKRKVIRKLVAKSSFMYVISKKMKEEYEGLLDIECKILYKTPDTTRQQTPYTEPNNPVRFLFTGNIYANRWKTLAMLATELQKQQFGALDIYTATPISKKMRKALDIPGSSYLHAPVSQNEVIELQNKADVLVHTEAFDRYNKSLVRCAISTKIMDYLCVGRCILAIGPNDISSIEYLADNDLALVASDATMLNKIITTIKNNTSILQHYANRGIEYTKTELNADVIRQNLYDNLQKAIDTYKFQK